MVNMLKLVHYQLETRLIFQNTLRVCQSRTEASAYILLYLRVSKKQYSIAECMDTLSQLGFNIMKTPIYNWREIVGYADTEKQAVRIVENLLNIEPGFCVRVWKRPDYICEICLLPAGFVYSIPHRSQA